MKFIKAFYRVLFIFFLLVSCEKEYPTDPIPNSLLSALEEISANESSKIEKKKRLNEIYSKISEVKDGSLKKELLLKISYEFLKLKDSSNFRETNKEALELSLQTNDSTGIAASYWDLGEFFNAHNEKDSSYYFFSQSQLIYEKLDNTFNSGRLLLNMAIIQKNIRDYTGSEVTTIKAIDLLKPLHKYKQLYSAYNNLGIIFKELGEYDKSFEYYQEAYGYLSLANREDLYPALWNNIGVVYQNKGDFQTANGYFRRALNFQDDLFDKDKALYAKLLDNQAYTKFKSEDTTEVLKDLKKALNIRRELNLDSDIIVNLRHLSEYFASAAKDTTTALYFAYQAKDNSLNTQNTRDLLSSLLLLANLDKDLAFTFSREYIKINDSLQKEERATRNKFARIRFETDEYISETERLNQRVVRISFIAISLILISVLLYIIKDQWSRNRFIKQKQDANQEIYNLILAQQKNFEEGREIEKQHISRELHDGILGKLFGVRLSLDSLNEEDTPEVKKKRFEYIEEIQNIAEEIRFISHRLNKVSLIDVDFKTVLDELIEKQNRGKIKFYLEVSSAIDWKYIEDNIKINIYRILQEAISNIHKHSEATEAFVQVRKNEGKLILEIYDNGKGISRMQSSTGIGLKNMKARAKNIGGTLEITQKSDGIQGSTIKLTVKLR